MQNEHLIWKLEHLKPSISSQVRRCQLPTRHADRGCFPRRLNAGYNGLEQHIWRTRGQFKQDAVVRHSSAQNGGASAENHYPHASLVV
jgi:hypothetical protein